MATSTSYSLFTNFSITSSSASPSNCPCAMPMRALGTNLRIMPPNCGKSATRLWIKNTWPPRSISCSTASFIRVSLNTCSSVTTGCLFGGGVDMMDKSLAPISEKCNVRGIGVAVSVSVSTLARICFSFSLVLTPNFCSSSIIIRPRSLNFTSLLTKRCVPMIISTLPFFRFSSVSFICLLLLKRFT